MYNFVYDRSTPLKLYSRKGTGVPMIVSLSLKLYYMSFYVDITFCLDISSNMERIIDNIKNHISELPEFIQDTYSLEGKTITNMRAKIMTFGNFDEGTPISHSRWFYIKGFDSIHNNKCNKLLVSSISSLSDYESIEFKHFVNNIHLEKNATNISNGLEALSQAIKSDWISNGEKRRHVIVIYTLNEASKLEESNRTINIYPNDIPVTLKELTDTWIYLPSQTEGLTKASKMLIVCAPQNYPWPEIFEAWDQVTYNPSVKDSFDLFYEDVFNCIFSDI